MTTMSRNSVATSLLTAQTINLSNTTVTGITSDCTDTSPTHLVTGAALQELTVKLDAALAAGGTISQQPTTTITPTPSSTLTDGGTF